MKSRILFALVSTIGLVFLWAPAVCQFRTTESAPTVTSEGAAGNLMGELIAAIGKEKTEVAPTLFGGGQYQFGNFSPFVLLYTSKPEFDTVRNNIVRNLLVTKHSYFAFDLGARYAIPTDMIIDGSVASVSILYTMARKSIPVADSDTSAVEASMWTNNYRGGLEWSLSKEFTLFGYFRILAINEGQEEFASYFKTSDRSFTYWEIGGRYRLNLGSLNGVFLDARIIPVSAGLQTLMPKKLATALMLGLGFDQLIQ